MTVERVYVYGAGKVGSALTRGLRAVGVAATLRAARRGWPKRRLNAQLVIIAVRDGDIERAAAELAASGLLERPGAPSAVVHCAGVLGAEALATLRDRGVAVGQLHPLLSFADAARAPTLAGAFAHVSGDRGATRLASEAARKLGMTPACIEGLDLGLYHAAAAMLANGAAAVAGAAGLMLERAGASHEQTAAMLGPLLASVATNMVRLGLPDALTGPVRRGDVAAVDAHLQRLATEAPELVGLYQALLAAQLPMARQLNEATAEKWRAIEKLASRR